MKKLLFSLCIACLVVLQACNNDDDTTPTTVTATDFTASIDENSANGISLGTVSATASDGSTLTYSLSNENVSGALAIDANTGELTIADETAFDFETNPSITASYKASNGTEEATASITITVNDVTETVDVIANNLTTSLTAYQNASDGDWVIITGEEYEALATNVSSTSRSGVSNGAFGVFKSSSQIASGTWAVDQGGIAMPNGSYLYAFKVWLNAGGSTSNQVLQSSTNVSSGFANVGSSLPATSDDGVSFYVLKGSNTPTTNTGYLAFFSSSLAHVNTPGANSVRWASGLTNTLSNSNSDMYVYIQGLSTTEKQW